MQMQNMDQPKSSTEEALPCDEECKTFGWFLQPRYMKKKVRKVKRFFKRKKRKKCTLAQEPDCMEFVIPVKVVLVDTPPQPTYDQKRWGLAFVALAYYLIGATSMPIMAFTLAYKFHWTKNMHIFLCTFGYQVMMPCGLLHISKMNGLASVASANHRVGESITMRLIGALTGFGGAYIVYHFHTYFLTMLTVHSWSGLLTLASNAADMASVIFYFPSRCFRFCKLMEVVKIFSVCTTFFAFVCFSTGVLKSEVISWFPHIHMGYFVVVICEYHTVLIMYRLLVDIKHAFQYKYIPPIDLNTTQLPCPKVV